MVYCLDHLWWGLLYYLSTIMCAMCSHTARFFTSTKRQQQFRTPLPPYTPTPLSTEHAQHSQANNSPNCTATCASKLIHPFVYQSQYYSSSLFSFAMSSWDAFCPVSLSFWGRRTIVLLLGGTMMMMCLSYWENYCCQSNQRVLRRVRVVGRRVGRRIDLFGGEEQKSLCLWCVK